MSVLPLELTLIVAATRDMGIGLNGTLPWTGLKKEMAYFARVTKRLPPQVQPPALNAVIMGRKTWDSIPPRFRPLRDRLNVVISRSFPSAAAAAADDGVVRASSLEHALACLAEHPAAAAAAAAGRVFVIGGAQIYAAALRLAEARRVLLTRVREPAFECDVHFSLKLSEDGKGNGGWSKRSKKELDAWVGEEVPEGVQVEGETRYEFEMWEKETEEAMGENSL